MPPPKRNQARYDLAVRMRQEGKTFAEIAIVLNVCKARACQMVARELARIEFVENSPPDDGLEQQVGKWAANVLRKNGLITKPQTEEALLSGRYLARCGKTTRAILWHWVQSDRAQ